MGGTGIVRDDLFIEHDPGEWHPESPARLKAIYKILDRMERHGLITLPRRLATKEEILLIHQPGHLDRMAGTEGQSRVALDADTHVSSHSFQAALAAAGGLIGLTEKVIHRELNNGFALVRPPGHHAEAARAMGFCMFNNVAVAAAWAVQVAKLSRVMIVDWDLHHGNGTQHSFESDPRVLYFSTHQYPFYPGTGALGETGKGPGLGYTMNVPLSWGHGDEEYVAIFKNILLPVARLFKPELILVSAGFDIYRGDPLGDMQVSTDGFAALARIVLGIAQEVCNGRVVFTLEGGYHIDGQASGVDKILDVLLGIGDAGQELALRRPAEPNVVSQVRNVHKDKWQF
jgi:acetoin utilization deacetylase AcuC-like enzyme